MFLAAAAVAVVTFVAPSRGWAQPAVPAAAPMAPQIAAARTVFISNAGQENNPFGAASRFSGGPDRAYEESYGLIKAWGRYHITLKPAKADLILQLRFVDPVVGADVFKGDTIGGFFDPRFRLVILDPETHVILWAFTGRVGRAKLQSNRDKNFDEALSRIVGDLKTLVATQAP